MAEFFGLFLMNHGHHPRLHLVNVPAHVRRYPQAVRP